MGVIREIPCQFCKGGLVVASRSDGKRCKGCRSSWLKEYRKRPEVRERRIKYHRALRQKAFDGYGGACNCCGESEFEFLALDHVNGGGNIDKRTRSTWQIARDVIERGFPDDFRVLCHNCNMALGFFGYCPHDNWERTA